MKLQAYMPVYNEADVLPHVLRHLHEQGCVVHCIDGWSDDGSQEIIAQLADSAETFPADRPAPTQECRAILRRIEDLAAGSDADWILYTDADEWRRSMRAGETLSEMCTRLEATGINAVDFRVIQFYCTDDIWSWDSSSESPEQCFRFYNETDCISRLPNRKLWKNVGRVTLAGGGHEVTFPGIRVSRSGVMKHYPFRTPAQARAKIETRRSRRCHEEHAAGWGVHYDQYPKDFDFCWKESDLKFWYDTSKPLP